MLVPTHVGMSRRPIYLGIHHRPCPHTRGDVPRIEHGKCVIVTLSPHTWGCPVYGPTGPGDAGLVPTHVGMSREFLILKFNGLACPHTRGDVPLRSISRTCDRPLSPHTWGCPVIENEVSPVETLVPTHVGMSRIISVFIYESGPCPHTRGDVPQER